MVLYAYVVQVHLNYRLRNFILAAFCSDKINDHKNFIYVAAVTSD